MATVAVAGFGCVCACGNQAEQCFNDGALAGQARFCLPADRVESAYAARFPVFQVAPEILAQKPPHQSNSLHFFLTAARESFAQAGILPEQLRPYRVGVLVGTSVDASFHCFRLYAHWKQRALVPTDIDELQFYLSTGSTAQTVSQILGFTGPFQTIVTACAGGTDAVGLGKSWIENDVCDVVLCGGTDEINLVPYDGFIRLLVASKERCKPFSKDRSGINIGEGAGALLLVSEKVRRDLKLSPQGFVLGYGNAADSYHPTAPHPQGAGLQRALLFALKQADLSSKDIAFVNAHGTASLANDAAEGIAFKNCLPDVPVWGSKGVTGHTLGAAGAVEAVLTLTALNQKILPPTHGFTTVDETIGFAPTVRAEQITKRAAVSDSLAFGGCNAALVLGARDYEN